MRRLSWLLVIATFVLAGCTAPRELSRDEINAKGRDFLARHEVLRWARPQAWTLEDALLWALENNVEFRMASMEAAVATGNRKLARMEMLPGLTAQAGYRHRSNTLASYSESVDTGAVSVVPSKSSERSGRDESLNVSWDVLDFGLAYYRAREYGEQALAAQEYRRRAVQNVTRDLVYAWWRARAYHELAPKLAAMRADVDAALSQSEAIVRQRLGNPVQAVEFRSALLLILRRIDEVSLQLDSARDDFAGLLGLPAGTDFAMRFPEQDGAEPGLPDMGLDYWQALALARRPEIREAYYRTRAEDATARRSLLKVLPSIRFSAAARHDDNPFLVNPSWQDNGVQVSWNLMQLASLPWTSRNARLGRELAQAKEEAQSVAVMSQVAIARKGYEQNQRAWCLSKALLVLDNDKTALLSARSAAASLDQLSFLRARLDNLLLATESALQYADYQRARLTLLLSAGVLEMPARADTDMVPVIRSWLDQGLEREAVAAMREVATDFNLPALPADPDLEHRKYRQCIE